MAVHINVRGGTARTDTENLCLACRHGMSATDDRGVRYTRCRNFDMRITARIVECTAYLDRAQPSLYDMEQISWVLLTGEDKAPMGFRPYRELKADEKKKMGFDEYGPCQD